MAKKKGRGEYSITDVVEAMRKGTALEQYEVTRYFPALVNTLAGDPAEAFVISFGHKRADGAEYKIRDAIGALKGGEDGSSEGSPEPEADPAAVAEALAEAGPAGPSLGEPKEPKAPKAKQSDPEPLKAVKEDKKAGKKSKDEDDIDALLNQLDEAVGEDAEVEEDGDGDE